MPLLEHLLINIHLQWYIPLPHSPILTNLMSWHIRWLLWQDSAVVSLVGTKKWLSCCLWAVSAQLFFLTRNLGHGESILSDAVAKERAPYCLFPFIRVTKTCIPEAKFGP